MVYEQLGYKAFGLPGKLAASCSITMQNFGGEMLNHAEFITSRIFCISISVLAFPELNMFYYFSLSTPAMSSYLYIVKYELPIVIKAFTGDEE